MQVVHTFNTNIDVQGTMEDLPDAYARSLIRTGRARAATEDEISTGQVAVPELAEDQAPLGQPAPAQTGGPADTLPTDAASVPETPKTDAAPSTAKPAAPKKPAPPAGLADTTPSTTSDAPAK
jgi:hypothetical protein